MVLNQSFNDDEISSQVQKSNENSLTQFSSFSYEYRAWTLYCFQEGGQGLLPVLVLSMKESEKKRRPAIVFLHSTNKCKEWLRPLLEVTFVIFLKILEFSLQWSIKDDFFFQGYASRGYIAVAIDSRYHGERATSITTYRDVSILLVFLCVYSISLCRKEISSPDSYAIVGYPKFVICGFKSCYGFVNWWYPVIWLFDDGVYCLNSSSWRAWI